MKQNKPATDCCPCGSTRSLEQCCLPYLRGTALAPNAELLMRSRYTAYVMADLGYLKASWHPASLPPDFEIASQRDMRWLGLKIKRHEVIDDDHARVEFIARYKLQGRAYRMQETSEFERCDGRWLYRGEAPSDSE